MWSTTRNGEPIRSTRWPHAKRPQCGAFACQVNDSEGHFCYFVGFHRVRFGRDVYLFSESLLTFFCFRPGLIRKNKCLNPGDQFVFSSLKGNFCLLQSKRSFEFSFPKKFLVVLLKF